MAAFLTRVFPGILNSNVSIKSFTLLPRNLNISAALNIKADKELTVNEVENDVLYRQIELEARGHDPEVLKSYEYFAVRAAKNLGIHFEKSWEPPKHLERYTLLKSVHIFKKHRVQYEMRTYFKIMQFKYLTGSTADTYLEYVERNLPEGVALKVTKHACETLPESFNL